MSKHTTVTHKGTRYDITVDGWLNNLDSELKDAIETIFTDDIIICDGVRVGEFKNRVRDAYNSLPDKLGLSAQQYLDNEIRNLYGRDWRDCIAYLKREIHAAFMGSAFKADLTIEEQKRLLMAASNGHVAAMYFIGSALADKNEDDNSAVMWLVMAHERGHLAACYELSRYFDKWNNVVDSIRCLIIAADMGMDVAYLSIFHLEHLKKMAAYKNKDKIYSMLDELLTVRPHSAARFFKCVLLFSEGKNERGIRILNDINEHPKNKIKGESMDSSYIKQAEVTKKTVSRILASIADGSVPLVAIFNVCEQSDAISYADHTEMMDAMREVW